MDIFGGFSKSYLEYMLNFAGELPLVFDQVPKLEVGRLDLDTPAILKSDQSQLAAARNPPHHRTAIANARTRLA